MTAPRFIPRQYCAVPSEFGHAKEVAWRRPSGSSDDLDQWSAARMQHAVAVAIREALASRGLTLDQYAEVSGMNRTRLGRLLRGDIVMRLEDIANARRNLGITS